MTELDKTTIESLITQWKHFSEYIEKLDTEHWHVFTVVFAAFGLFSIAGGKEGISIIIYWIIPFTIMIHFYYEAYRLREVAIMKGFLARIEKTINQKIKELSNESSAEEPETREELFNWFYSYELVFMTNNNKANQFFQYPIILVCIVVYVLSGIYGWRAMQEIPHQKVLFLICYVISLIFDGIALGSISNTLRVSIAAFSRDITGKQEKYRKAYEKRYRKYHFDHVSEK